MGCESEWSTGTLFGVVTQLAIRFSEQQIRVLDALASEAGTTRSAVVKQLVDDAERHRISALYAAAYPRDDDGIDAFGDLRAFHDDSETERCADRESESYW